jgi:5-oxoprolinase (ATP-hydrolysing) subunit A
MRVDLNADVGELGELGQDPALMRTITSANVACGFHAGGPATMRATVALARAHGVAVGAHPSFHDVAGFGRRELPATPREVEDLTLYQLGALAGIAAAEGVRLTHVKAHGALYNMAAREAALADALAAATVAFDRSLVFVGLAGSALIRAGERAGLRVAREVFADRAYQRDGSLVPRQQAGAVIHEPREVVERAVRMVTERRVHAIDGTMVALEADTICVHGDTPDAAALAARVRDALQAAGVEVRAFET